MIGIDIVEIERIEHIYRKHGELFIEKILSDKERQDLPDKQNWYFFRSLSCYIASKEAIFKAFSVKDLDWRDISISNLSKNPTIHVKNVDYTGKIVLTCSSGKGMVISQAVLNRN